MSIPRRIALHHHAARYALRQSVPPGVCARFGECREVPDSVRTITLPLACRLELRRAPGTRALLRLRDGDGRTVSLTVGADTVSLDRRSAIHEAFDRPIDVAVTGERFDQWLDTASIELADATGACWISVQHGMCGATVEMTVERGDGMALSVAMAC